MRSASSAVIVALSLLGAGACAAQPVSSSFTSSEAMRMQPVASGQVVAVRAVDIRPGNTNVGMATGVALGAIAGSQLGGGRAANTAGGIGGAVLGGALGSAAQGARTTRGIEVTVTLDVDGQTVAIVQPGDIRDFRVGDQVRVVGARNNARVTR
jgi:outer membrane lipoprotein SlyB